MTNHAFHRWVNPLRRTAPGTVEIEADETEQLSLAAWLDIPGVKRLKASLRLARESADAVSVRGAFQAEVDLVCGVTLEAFPHTLDGTIDAVFLKDSGAPAHPGGQEVEVNIDTEEPHPWTAQGIDLGGLLAEELSLAIPDFPRKPGVELSAPEGVPGEEPRPNPFAVLAKLPRAGD
jgi:uncharacterized metal-binding protein YceD (DUF177 family)